VAAGAASVLKAGDLHSPPVRSIEKFNWMKAKPGSAVLKESGMASLLLRTGPELF
jgi:hypothetical protein